jgi:hypothetical protein
VLGIGAVQRNDEVAMAVRPHTRNAFTSEALSVT